MRGPGRNLPCLEWLRRVDIWREGGVSGQFLLLMKVVVLKIRYGPRSERLNGCLDSVGRLS